MSPRTLAILGTAIIGAGLAVLAVTLLRPSDSGSPEGPTVAVAVQETSSERADRLDLATRWFRGVEARLSKTLPALDRCEPFLDGEPLAGHQIVSYYGSPYRDDMGVLGELEPEELVRRLKAHADLYDSLNGPRGVQAALHLVYAAAQGDPGSDGLYLLRVDDETLEDYIELACENELLIFLDLQIGLSDVESEVEQILPYLVQPHVHAALDPEWAMGDGEVPGEAFGSLDAADVNAAQAMIESLVEEWGLADKVLVVHQFIEDMLTNPELIEDYPRVRLVIDMDGFGPSDIKRVKYGWFAEPAEYSGIKLFFQQDTPLLSEAEVLELDPDVIIYQ